MVQIKMHDDMLIKLNCLYVPNLRKNLISFGTLAKYALKYYTKDDWVKVFHVALVDMREM